MQLSAYVTLLITTGLTSGVLAFHALRRSTMRGNTELGLLMLAIAQWDLAIAIETLSTSLDYKLIWSAVAYLGTTTTPVFLFLYAVRHAQLDSWLSRRVQWLLFLIPSITTILAATNASHGLIWPTVTLTPRWGGIIAQYAHGIWFHIAVGYSYVLVEAAMLALWWAIRHRRHLYSQQSRLLVAASAVPVLGSGLYVLHPRTIGGLDPTPAAFTLTGLLLALAILRYHLLELAPLAREILFESLQDGVLFLDAQQRIVDLNIAAQQLLGLSPSVIGRRAEAVLATWPRMVKLLQKQEPQAEVLEQASERRWLQVRLSLLYDCRRTVAGKVLVLQDITALKRAEEERLEMESLGIMAGGIAHDFNNLLTAIMGNQEMAAMALPPGAPAQESIEQARLATRRAANLTRQMLAYSGTSALVAEPVDLSRQIRAMSQLLKVSIPKTATLDMQLAQGLPAVMADPSQVEQIIMNLTINAGEAIGERPGVITLTTGAGDWDTAYLSRSRLQEKAPAGRYAFVQVSDTGCGMTEEVQEKLFDPFFSTKFAGRGLGMSAVLGIVREHGGAIMVDSAPGKGTTIRVLLPVPEGEPPAVALAASPEVPAAVSPLTLSGTVMVVDDEEMIRDMCRAMLERFGLNVLVAADGAEAVDLFRKHAEDIACIILDLTMPRMDGPTTLAALRAIRPDVRAIIASGLGADYIRERFAGQDTGCIGKPFDIQDLRDELQRALERSN